MERSISSDDLAATSAIVSAQPCTLTGVYLEGNGTGACSVILYDDAAAATGTVLARLALGATAVGVRIADYQLLPNIKAAVGVWAELSGSVACIVHFN